MPGLAGYVNVQKVSDDAYFTDLSDRLAITSQTDLPREGGFAYNTGRFPCSRACRRFQTLQDPDDPITPPYFREPQMLMTMSRSSGTVSNSPATGEYVRFRQPAAGLINGDRTVLYPTVAWTQRGNAWFFTARAGLHMTQLQSGTTTPNAHRQASRPRRCRSPASTAGWCSSATRTGSARASPRRSSRARITSTSRSATRARSGLRHRDRRLQFLPAVHREPLSRQRSHRRRESADAGACRRGLLEPQTGEERMRFAIGQRYYFRDQHVTLTEAPRTREHLRRALSGEAGCRTCGRFRHTRSTTSTIRRPSVSTSACAGSPRRAACSTRATAYIRQQVDPTGQSSAAEAGRFLGAMAGQDNWSVIGRWNYSIVDEKTLEGVIGVEYNGGCWAFRIVGTAPDDDDADRRANPCSFSSS